MYVCIFMCACVLPLPTLLTVSTGWRLEGTTHDAVVVMKRKILLLLLLLKIKPQLFGHSMTE
jgi:hypothetical protein